MACITFLYLRHMSASVHEIPCVLKAKMCPQTRNIFTSEALICVSSRDIYSMKEQKVEEEHVPGTGYGVFYHSIASKVRILRLKQCNNDNKWYMYTLSQRIGHAVWSCDWPSVSSTPLCQVTPVGRPPCQASMVTVPLSGAWFRTHNDDN